MLTRKVLAFPASAPAKAGCPREHWLISVTPHLPGTELQGPGQRGSRTDI